MTQPLLQLDRVTKAFGGRAILDGLSWRLAPGECAVILGPSGGGKTVFLHTILGMLAPDAGRVSMPGLEATPPFEAIAVMFQEDALLDDLSVEANLAIALAERLECGAPPFAEGADAAIDAVMREVRLDPAQVRRALPSALSGGMRRRVALARALIRRPRILIADEPTTGLDPAAAARVYDLLAELIARRAMSAVIITHDPACASRLGFPVYYFSPVGGVMPRWTMPEGKSYEERHRSLLLWMHEQIEAHARRQANAAEESLAPVEPFSWRTLFTAGLHRAVDMLGRFGLLLAQLRYPAAGRLLMTEMFAWVLGSVPLLALIFIMLGVVVEVQSELAVVEYGFSNRLPELVALSLTRVAPILMGFLIAGRCGSAIGARVGWMQLSGQARALRTMRIEPDRALFPPLFTALALGAPLLALLGLALGGLGAILVLLSPVSQAAITVRFFFVAFAATLTLPGILVLLVKGVLIGGGIALLAYEGGARPKRSPSDVTAAITRGLVLSFLWISLVDTLLSLLFPL